MGMNAYNVVREFEAAMCDYTGARFAVTTNSCTMALLLAVAWWLKDRDELIPIHAPFGHLWIPAGRYVEIPRRTYVSVPMSILQAGGRPTFRDEEWRGFYQLKPLPVWDSARFFTFGMFQIVGDNNSGHMACVSFHASKILGDTQGGAILHDNEEADAWLRRARFDGRTEGVAPKDDTFRQIGWHAYLSPDVAARLLLKLSVLPKNNEPLSNDDYPDLSKMEIFR